METKKITVISTKNQSKTVIDSNALTLGDLKVELDNAGIDYKGMTFYEGITKTELIDDSSLLPKDVTYKGEVTNNLVFMLTVPNKKIGSGTTITSRKEIGIYFKKHKDIYDEFKETFHKNWTICKTSDIIDFINDAESKKITKEGPKEEPKEVVEEEMPKVSNELSKRDLLLSIKALVDRLLELEDVPTEEPAESKNLYSEDEIQDMFGSILK